MDTLKDIIIYICINYQKKDNLSKARLVKMIYLVDWKSALLHRKQITTINWIFNHYGPYVDDVLHIVKNDQDFNIVSHNNIYGGYKEIVKLNNKNITPNLSDNTKQVVDFVIEKTKDLEWNDFIRLIYSTYPIVTQEKYSKLDLVRLAEEYQKTI